MVNGVLIRHFLGAMMGAVKTKSSVAVFDIRTRGKNIEIKLNSRLEDENKTKSVIRITKREHRSAT
jgi:hypothetical protein